MAIYYPELYCGIGSTIKVKKSFIIEFDDEVQREYLPDEICIVNDIIGYGYDIKSENDSEIFRIMNSSMVDYFEIIRHIPFEESIPEEFDNFPLVSFKKNFKIDGMIIISENETFKHEVNKSDKIFHNLYSIEKKRKVLRMKDDEFKEFIK